MSCDKMAGIINPLSSFICKEYQLKIFFVKNLLNLGIAKFKKFA
jgi:hypothetical protein